MAAPLQLNFGKLPLVEAAVRCTFAEPITLKFTIVNTIFEKLRHNFPTLGEPEQYEGSPGATDEVSFGPGTIVGLALEGHPKGLRATIQRRVAVVRWLKQATSGAPEYPRFGTLRDTMRETINATGEACARVPVPIVVVNMSYMNVFRVNEFSSVLPDYFTDLVQVRAFREAATVHKLELSWQDSGVDLRFCLDKIIESIGEEKKEACRLTTVAGKRLPNAKDDAMQGLEDVHARLQSLFVNVISDRAKREWELQGTSK